MAVMMLVSGRLFDKHGLKKLAVPGIILLIVSTVPFTNLQKDTSLMFITVFCAIRYLGIALVIMPMQTAGMNSLPKELLAHGNAVVNTAKQIVGSLGTAVLITVMSNVTSKNAPVESLATTNSALYKSLILDASLKGIDTTFAMMIGLIVIALVMAFFLKDKNYKKNKKDKLFLKDINEEEQIA